MNVSFLPPQKGHGLRLSSGFFIKTTFKIGFRLAIYFGSEYRVAEPATLYAADEDALMALVAAALLRVEGLTLIAVACHSTHLLFHSFLASSIDGAEGP